MVEIIAKPGALILTMHMDLITVLPSHLVLRRQVVLASHHPGEICSSGSCCIVCNFLIHSCTGILNFMLARFHWYQPTYAASAQSHLSLDLQMLLLRLYIIDYHWVRTAALTSSCD